MKEFSNVFDERGEHRICSDSAEPEKQRMQFNVYFLGIGGIGMSALARYFLHEGRRVAGYDRVRSHLTDQIEAEGAVVHYEEDPAQIPVDFRDPATTIVVYTPAVPADHAELRWFRQNGFEIVKRSQMLGYLSQGKFVMAVAGTHGKTTTTTLVAWLNHRVTGGGSAFLGGISRNFSSNLVLGSGRRLAVEADEFDRSFLRLWPDVAVVTSADADHLDIYGTHEALREAFSQFVGQIREGGALVVKQGVDLKIGNPGIRVYRYSYDEPCDFYARNVTLLEGGHYRYDLVTPGGVVEGCTLGIPGWVNIENAVAAVAALWCASERDGEPLDAERLREALASFEGVKRRFEFYVNTPRQVYMDDYAHHPRELAAAITSVKSGEFGTIGTGSLGKQLEDIYHLLGCGDQLTAEQMETARKTLDICTLNEAGRADGRMDADKFFAVAGAGYKGLPVDEDGTLTMTRRIRVIGEGTNCPDDKRVMYEEVKGGEERKIVEPIEPQKPIPATIITEENSGSDIRLELEGDGDRGGDEVITRSVQKEEKYTVGATTQSGKRPGLEGAQAAQKLNPNSPEAQNLSRRELRQLAKMQKEIESR